MDAEEAYDTHSTVWMVHGVVAPVLLDRHTVGEKEKNRHLRTSGTHFEEILLLLAAIKCN